MNAVKVIMRYSQILIMAFLIMAFSSCTFEEENNSVYDESTIMERRKDLDDFFKNDPSSPLKDSQKEAFSAMQYFPPSEDYAFYAEFAVNPKPDTIQLLTSKGSEKRAMLRYGRFTFQAQDGSEYSLTGFRSLNQEDDVIFIPFKDKTNGFDTYEAGRYLEVDEISGSEEYLLDFNRAYNPYCAYNKEYVCPLVPKENMLSISIKAGEKRPIFQ